AHAWSRCPRRSHRQILPLVHPPYEIQKSIWHRLQQLYHSDRKLQQNFLKLWLFLRGDSIHSFQVLDILTHRPAHLSGKGRFIFSSAEGGEERFKRLGTLSLPEHGPELLLPQPVIAI